ncbi:MAG: HIT domain-containing protein [Planctomycetota bacterium]
MPKPDSAADDRSRLWAPWRIDYVTQLGEHGTHGRETRSGCFLCDAFDCRRDDGTIDEAQAERDGVLVCDDRGVMLMNRYPYANGHILIAPEPHVPALRDLTANQRAGIMDLAEQATRMQEAALGTHGANIGINQGRAAGAGVPGHLHMHVVPRWHGDVSFMEVVTGTRVIPQALERSYELLREAAKET